MRRAIIGIDCAVDPKRVGLALGWLDGEGLEIVPPGADTGRLLDWA